MRFFHRLGIGGLLALSAFVVASAGYTGCTGEVHQTTYLSPPSPTSPAPTPTGSTRPPPEMCPPDLIYNIGKQRLCCGGLPECVSLDYAAAHPGGACSPGSPDTAVDLVVGKLDACVVQSCDGDTAAPFFLDTATESTGTLACVPGSGGSTWQWKGPVNVHEVTLACEDVGVVTCAPDTTYGYRGYGDTCGCHTGPAGRPVCWDGSPCQSPYGYMGFGTIMQRDVRLVSSTCSTAGATPTPCPEGTL